MIRIQVDLQKELIVEVEINETKVAQEMLQALYLCTGYQDLPQVFVCETFIGKYRIYTLVIYVYIYPIISPSVHHTLVIYPRCG